MREVAQIGVARVVVDLADLQAELVMRERFQPVAVTVDGHDIEIAQVGHRLGVGDDGGNVAGQEMFVRTDAEHERAAAPRAYHGVRLILVNGDQPVGAGDFLQSLHYRHLQAVVGLGVERLEVAADEEGKHLGVGLGAELASLVLQLLLQQSIILDHAVVDHGQFAGGVEVGMGVRLGRLAVGGPAGVADAERAVERMLAQRAFQLLDAPDPLDYLQALAVEDGDAAGIVSAVFEPAQALKEKGLGFLVPQISDDSTHANLLVATRAG